MRMIFLKKWIKRILTITLLLIILTSGSILFINYRITKLASNYIVTPEEVSECQAALVLGALVYRNGYVSPILADRLDVGIDLYRNRAVNKLLLSGDHGQKSYDEVNAMKKYVISKNIDTEDIFLDHAGFNTYQSIYRAKSVFQAEKVIIVTQKYHLYRAVYIARKLGIDAYGVSSDKHYYPKILVYEFRESLARCKDFFLVNFLKPKPKYLGEQIDLTGDGRVTFD